MGWRHVWSQKVQIPDIDTVAVHVSEVMIIRADGGYKHEAYRRANIAVIQIVLCARFSIPDGQPFTTETNEQTAVI